MKKLTYTPVTIPSVMTPFKNGKSVTMGVKRAASIVAPSRNPVIVGVGQSLNKLNRKFNIFYPLPRAARWCWYVGQHSRRAFPPMPKKFK